MGWLARLQRRTVIVTTTEDQSFRGLLAEGDDEHYAILSHARLLGDEASEQINGEVWIPRARVHFFQVLPPGGE